MRIDMRDCVRASDGAAEKARSAKRILFLDRDGVLISDTGYISNPKNVRMEVGAAAGLEALDPDETFFAVVSNQSGIARGLYGLRELWAVHDAFEEAYAGRGIRFDWVCYCPYHKDGSIEALRQESRYRKPERGMADLLFEQFSLKGLPAYMAGDKVSDVEFGLNCGAHSCLVLTGQGAANAPLCRSRFPDCPVVSDLSAAIHEWGLAPSPARGESEASGAE